MKNEFFFFFEGRKEIIEIYKMKNLLFIITSNTYTRIDFQIFIALIQKKKTLYLFTRPFYTILKFQQIKLQNIQNINIVFEYS